MSFPVRSANLTVYYTVKGIQPGLRAAVEHSSWDAAHILVDGPWTSAEAFSLDQATVTGERLRERAQDLKQFNILKHRIVVKERPSFFNFLLLTPTY